MNRVYVYCEKNGHVPFFSFYEELPAKMQQKVWKGIRCLAVFPSYRTEPHVKHFTLERYMDFYEYPDGSGYEGRFTRCGICVLMKKLGLYDLTPALCHLDYTMSEAGGATDFVREYTLASGGPYCDCGYKRKTAAKV